MSNPAQTIQPSPIHWREDGLPASSLYGDVYFSSEDGLAETRTVFLAGCGLPQAWAGRSRFTVAELGFGTGLNIAALLQLWGQTRPPGGRLQIFSLEAHPLSRDEAARALGHWPELGSAATALLAAWPGQARGLHRIDLPEFGATLDLAVMEAETALDGWNGQADAWFLDGFAPAANPAMWTDRLLGLVGQRSAPGARVGTFTVAGAVRRGLETAGFAVSKQPGFGRKRQRLEAVWPGVRTDGRREVRTAAVVGAGIAGAAMARALRQQGVEVLVFDPRGPAAAASGNAAALMTPRLDAGGGPAARLHAQAFRRAVQLYEQWPDVVIARGARQLATSPRDGGRFQRIIAGGLFDPGSLETQPGSLQLHQALVLDPRALIPAWTGPVDRRAIGGVRTDGRAGWRLEGLTGETLARVDALVLCAGLATAEFSLDPGSAPLRAVRGQVSRVQDVPQPEALAFGGYVIPTRDGLLFGATHQRDRTDDLALPEDDAANLRQLAEGRPDLALALAARMLEGRPLEGRAGVRAATPDHLPLAGQLARSSGEPGGQGSSLYGLAGFGGRGFCLAPLLAEHLAANILELASPLPLDLARAVDPGRFAERAARRASKRSPS
ncbi:MAG: tRNA (5-methylaminomethyl-2-thiouridine)(34)-methyltransferase MnmD [Caulobacter sp.]|nr:tRNA (5-methylaminomethyl-2-thiouridine)(34)-methyltransferase MnmD [Caulobacter sp.]